MLCVKRQKDLLNQSYQLALKAFKQDEVPVGALIVYKGEIIAEAYNQKESLKSVLKHAELIAIEKASKRLNSWRLEDCELYVNLQPCMMCYASILEARIKKVYFSCYQSDFYKKKSLLSFYEETRIQKIQNKLSYQEEENKKLLKDFFKSKRN